MPVARKLISLRVATPEGFVDIPADQVIAQEFMPYPHVCRQLPGGEVIHYFNFALEMRERVSGILVPDERST